MLRRVLVGLMVVTSACGGSWIEARPTVAPPPPTTAATTPAAPPPTSVDGDGDPTPPPCVTTECPMAVSSRHADRIRCGSITVPMRRAAPDDRTVELAIAVISSDSATPAPDPVVYLHGGPGGAAVAEAEAWLDPRSPLLAERDLILVDQRGSGFSRPSLDCPELDEFASGFGDRRCRSRLVGEGVDLAGFTTVETVADLDDLRRALGHEAWNLYGVSYGTRVALTALRDRPEGIRSVILDSAYPPVVDAYDEEAVNARDAIVAVTEACSAQPPCAERYPDLSNRLTALIERLETDPIRGPIPDPATGFDRDELIDGVTFADLLFAALYDISTIEWVPAAIDAAERGEIGIAAEWLTYGGFGARRQPPDGESIDFAEGVQYAIECAEEVPFNSLDRAIAQAGDDPLARALLLDAELTTRACDEWDVEARPAIEDEPVVSDVPALVLAGEFDPITPPRWGEVAARTLSRATSVLIAAQGHVPSFTDRCAEELTAAFVTAPHDVLDVSCAAALPPVDFVLDP